jgi:hypothetical protein
MRLSTAAYGCCVATQPETAGDPLVPFRAHATSASSKDAGWAFSGALDVRRRPQGLRVATDAGALRIGDLASPTDCRTTRQNDGRRHPGRIAERHVGRPRGLQTLSLLGGMRHAANRRSGEPWSAGAAVGRVIYDEPVIGGAAHSESDVPPRAPTGRGSLAPRPTVSVFAACCKRIA